jgi:FkbM family methyltransferase
MIFNIGDKVHRNVLVSCDHGLMIINRFDCGHNQVGHGQWLIDHGNASTIEASKCYDSIRHINNPVIFDIGSNIGTFTTWMSKACNNGKIYSFEPQRSVFQLLCGNVAINNLYNVYTYNLAIGKENSKIKFKEPDYFSKNDFGTFSLIEKVINENPKEEIIVDINTLDWFVEYHEIPKVDLIKIDVEGMDIDVLLGAKTTIDKFKPVIFIEHNDSRKSIINEIQLYLNQFDYQYEVVGNNLLCKI